MNEYFKIFSGICPDGDLNSWLMADPSIEILDFKFAISSNIHRAICVWYRRK